MKHRIEMIPKRSVIDDVVEYWKASGREPGTDKGEFVFEDVDFFHANSGVLQIDKGDNRYWYNIADFYRIKVMPSKQGDMFDD